MTDVAARLREKAKWKRSEAVAFAETWGVEDVRTLPESRESVLLDLLADCAERIESYGPPCFGTQCAPEFVDRGLCSCATDRALLARIEAL